MFAAQRYGGISRYFCDLRDDLRLAGIPSVVLAPIWRTEVLARGEGSRGLPLPERLEFRGVPRLLQLLSNIDRRLRLPLLRSGGNQVLHPTYYSSCTPTRHLPMVVTVFDMIHERFPELFPPNNTIEQKRRAILAADAIIAISNHTKECLAERYNISADRISVVHLGVPQLTTRNSLPGLTKTFPPFILYVGSRRGYKNFDALLTAFAHSGLAKDGIHLVAFGGGPLSTAERQRAAQLAIDRYLIQVEGDDATLAAAYQQAQALVYPSLDEGFGLPPLEAMSHGCPVVASDAGAIPEVVDQAGYLFDPTNVEDIASALLYVVSNQDLRQKLVDNGKSRVSFFSRERQVQGTIEVYRRVCGH